MTQPAFAANFTLTNGNSTADFDNSLGTGFVSWKIDGVDQIDNSVTAGQTATYFRIGDSTEQTLVEEFSPDLFEEVLSLSGNKASVKYTDFAENFTINFDFLLKGDSLGTNRGSLSQTMTVTNISNAPLDFRLFQYNDFNINGTVAPNKVKIDEDTFTATQTSPLGRGIATFVTPTPTAAIAALVPDLVDFSPLALNNTVGNPVNLSGPLVLNGGDASFAYQWNFNLAPNQSVVVIQTATTIPEPSISLATLIAFGFGFLKSRKRS
ncbi:hypothetical protein IQ274_31035 [Nostoc sp. LEGE 12447]|uniref:hypothetical protein n=1 Tax=Nostoc sp. LEGE 12447 TaxID=1828640 RepID=UPI001883FD3A|nr:hypothetical protein [Nostoc sp. LEGE 12447]MBE9002502.1 hypothetical protein [Nostoc sp. LEGE 12447]